MIHRWYRTMSGDAKTLVGILAAVVVSALVVMLLFVLGYMTWWVCDAIRDSRP